jgi:hypothetical protein
VTVGAAVIPESVVVDVADGLKVVVLFDRHDADVVSCAESVVLWNGDCIAVVVLEDITELKVEDDVVIMVAISVVLEILPDERDLVVIEDSSRDAVRDEEIEERVVCVAFNWRTLRYRDASDPLGKEVRTAQRVVKEQKVLKFFMINISQPKNAFNESIGEMK